MAWPNARRWEDLHHRPDIADLHRFLEGGGLLPGADLTLGQRGAAGDLKQPFDEAVEIGLDERVDAAEVGDVALSGLARLKARDTTW